MKSRVGLRPPFPTDSFVTNQSPSVTPPTSAPPMTRQTMRYLSGQSQLQSLPEITVEPPTPTPSMLPMGYEELMTDSELKCEAKRKAADKRTMEVPNRRFIPLALSVAFLLVVAILIIIYSLAKK